MNSEKVLASEFNVLSPGGDCSSDYINTFLYVVMLFVMYQPEVKLWSGDDAIYTVKLHHFSTAYYQPY